MDSRARMLAVLLEMPVVSVVSMSRAARVWPSAAEFFLATERDAGRLTLVGKTLPDRRGRVFDLFVVAGEAARRYLEEEHRNSAEKSWGSLVGATVHDDLLEPPPWTLTVIALARRTREFPSDKRAERLDVAEREYLRMSAVPDLVYDDSGRGDRISLLYRRLARVTLFLVRAETDGTGPEAPALFREFEELSGELLLMGEWHARYIAELAGFWRESPFCALSNSKE